LLEQEFPSQRLPLARWLGFGLLQKLVPGKEKATALEMLTQADWSATATQAETSLQGFLDQSHCTL